MQRWAAAYGKYNPRFGNRSWESLENVANKIGIYADEDKGQFFHNADFDSKATAAIWRYLDEKEIPTSIVKSDLISRLDHERIVKSLMPRLTGDYDPSKKNLLIDQSASIEAKDQNEKAPAF